MNKEYIFILCIGGLAMMIGYWIAGAILRRDEEQLLRRLRGGEEEPESEPARQAVFSLISRVGQAAAAPLMPEKRENISELRRKLAHAGFYSPTAMRMFVGSRVILLLGGGLLGYTAGLAAGPRLALFGAWFGATLGFVAPVVWLRLKISNRQRELEIGLPDAIDLMIVCVEAGLTIDAAMQRVGQELAIAHPQVARELDITHMETRVGLPRMEAMRNLARRTGSASLQSLSAMLVQAERFGTSIAATLRVQADSLRIKRQYAAEEMASKAVVKLVFPVVLCIFPAALVALAGPAFIRLFGSPIFSN